MQQDHQAHGGMSRDINVSKSHYPMFALNMAISVLIMYLGMFAMNYGWGEYYNNLNMFYMGLVMAAPMAVLMLVMMGSMYTNKRLNALIYAGSGLILILSFLGVRAQALVGDRQFVRSMIPHHSGAILMCERATITDPEIKALCGNIISSQKREIEQLKTIMARQ